MKAARFTYYEWTIWIPLKAVVQLEDGTYAAALWAIEGGKAHASARHSSDAQLREYQVPHRLHQDTFT